MGDRFDHTLEHTFKTKPDEPGDGSDDAVTGVRRIELITGTGRRRQWSDDDKARIIIESLRPGSCVSEVARRNGLSPQQLFGWRREARAIMAEKVDDASGPGQAASAVVHAKSGGRKPSAGESSSAGRVPAFAPVVVAAAAPPAPPSPPTPSGPPTSGSIEIALRDAVVRVVGQVEPTLLATVLRAVRRTT
jgi:transposase